MALGNHEFDRGPATLASFIQQASFPVLSANLDASADPDLGGLIKAYTVLDVAGEKVGVFGLTTPDAPSISSPGPNVVFGDAVDAAQAMVAALEGQGINKIVALTHLGYGVDKQLAAAVDGVDVVVGGHSHTPLGDMEGAQGPYPTVVTTPGGDAALVVTAFDWGRYLGRLDVSFTADGKVETYTGEPIFVDESIPEDAGIAADVATYAQPLEALKAHTVGQSAVDLLGDRELVRSQETNLANLICDAMLWKSAAQDTQICIINGGGIRSSIPAGDVSMGQVLEVLPFGNQIATFGLKGSDVWAAVEHGVSGYEEQSGAFPQVGGMRYSFDPDQPVGSRIISVEVKEAGGGYSPLVLDAVYKVTANEYMRTGGDGYDIFASSAIDPYDGGALLSDAVAEYIGAHSPVSPATEGRITMAKATLPVAGGESFEGPLAGFVVLLGAVLIVVGVSMRQGMVGSVPARDPGAER
jgi:5'-nucleotidase